MHLPLLLLLSQLSLLHDAAAAAFAAAAVLDVVTALCPADDSATAAAHAVNAFSC